MPKERGAALIIVILVVLVLTIVGLAAVYNMTVEDRISQNDKLSQAAWHAAQAGLKRGEQVFKGLSQSQLNLVLSPTTFSDAHNDVPTSPADLTTASHPGTVLYDSGANLGGSPLYAMPIGTPTLVGTQEVYSVYVRNDPNDYDPLDGSNYYVDHNGTVVLISRGVVRDASGREAAVKVLSEQIVYGSTAIQPKQFRGDQTGTSSTQYQPGG